MLENVEICLQCFAVYAFSFIIEQAVPCNLLHYGNSIFVKIVLIHDI